MEKVATITRRIRQLVDVLTDLCSTERESDETDGSTSSGHRVSCYVLCCPGNSCIQNITIYIVKVICIIIIFIALKI